MKHKIGLVNKYVVIFILMICFFYIGMIISYSIPNQKIEDNIKESMDFIEKIAQNNNPLFGEIIKGMQLDNFTDLLILNTALNKGKKINESVFVKAFENSRYSENENQLISLKKSLYNDNIFNNQEYSRYWHGIQTIIRPLLLIFNFEEIKVLIMIIMFILFGISINCIYKNLGLLYSLSFLISFVIGGFLVVSISLQYVCVFAITFIDIILISKFFERKKEYLCKILFFITGGCIAFFDLLTVPIISLGIPLIILILLKNKSDNLNYNFREMFFYVIELSFLWGISYILTFTAKWVIASVVLNRNAFSDAINQIIFRINGNETYPATKIGSIKNNLVFLNNKVFKYMFIYFIFIWLISILRYGIRPGNLKNIIILFIISSYPYIWYVIFCGHSTIHCFFTYRCQIISIYGCMCMMIDIIDIKDFKLKNNRILKK